MVEKDIKIAHISFEDSFGAGRAAIRISNAVNSKNNISNVYVLHKNEMADSYKIELGYFQKILMRLAMKLNYFLLKKYSKRESFHEDRFGINLLKNEAIRKADILHFHWVNDGIWSESFVRELIKINKPIVWTMHDMWCFTGGCHYNNFCEKYKLNCGMCKALYSKKQRDESFKAQKRKKKYMSRLNLQLVGCSNWITKCANDSTIGRSLKNKAVCIPNPINAKQFDLHDRELCKKLLGINSTKKLILFGAVNVAAERKGAKYILDAIKVLNPQKYILGVFGSKTIGLEINGFEMKNFGRITDDFHLSLMYNAADVFVAPSLQENLANTVMESLVSGTPVVAFNIGGMPDMINHCKNGYLANPFDAQDLANGIQYVENLKDKREKIRDDILERFSEEKIGELYIGIYKNLLNNA